MQELFIFNSFQLKDIDEIEAIYGQKGSGGLGFNSVLSIAN